MSLLKSRSRERAAAKDAVRPHLMQVLQSIEPPRHVGAMQNFRQRLAQAAGLTAILAFILADFFASGFTAVAALDWRMVALFLPFFLLPLALTFPAPSGPSSLRQYAVIAIFVFGVALASYLGISRRHSVWFNEETLTLATIYIYFLSGLPFRRAVFSGLAAWAAFAIAQMSDDGLLDLLQASPYLLVANGVGAAGLFYLEWYARERHRYETRLRSEAISDDLTQVLNRRAIQEHLRRVWRLARREQRSLCVLRLDIDNFRKINERVGHQMGSKVLCHVAEFLEMHAKRPLDAVGRSGTDEFIAVWFDADIAWFRDWARKLPSVLIKFPLGDAMDIEPLSVSGGAVVVAPRSLEETDWERLVDSLDENLAQARLRGRSQVVLTDLDDAMETVPDWSVKTTEWVAARPAD